MPTSNCVCYTRNRGKNVNRRKKIEERRKARNPFTKWATGSITAVLIGSAAFTMLIFNNSSIFRVSQDQKNSARDVRMPVTYSQEKITPPKKDNETNLGNVSTVDPNTSGGGNGTNPDPQVPGVPNTPAGAGTPDGITADYTQESWETALAQNGLDAYYAIGAGFGVTTHNGATYIVCKQTRTYYGNIKNGSNSSVAGVGCWIFAQVNAANALNGTTFSARDALQARWQCTIDWGGDAWLNPSGNENGQLSVGFNASGQDAEDRVWQLLGVKAELLSSSDMTAQECYDLIASNGWDNCCYIVYGHKSGVLSSGNDHWLACVGQTVDGFQFLGNGSRGDTKSIGEIGNTSGVFTRVLKITRR